MSRAVSIMQVGSALISGAKKAAKRYEDISGCWLSYAPESYLQSELFLELGTKLKIPVTLEDSPKKLKGYGHKCPDGRTTRTSPQSRFDLVGWYQNDTPRFIVEVKKFYNSTEGAVKDANRMHKWIGKTPAHMRDGFLVLYTEAKKPSTLEERFLRIVKSPAARYQAKLLDHFWKGPEDSGMYCGVGVLHIR